ncbi:hypothetical protein [Mycolicibacterium sp. 050158]|uniref:hypothetical protein n=1 Tax=Mycolicibacterium sp. 050158 TaxID=3090602 RepID=UPI00299D2FD6|nr:hypothetical protein [Mycolicibacterium sp. 050158]MDX1889963.1 hypothetical protein [Mycolicibacterium sp. 050158]
MSMDPMHTPGALNWDPASVELPELPSIQPGEDAMSMTIAAVLPTLTASMATSVAALQAKETTFSGKLGAAQSAYQNADDSGGQQVGQFGQMLGQLGQMAQQAGSPAQALGGQAGQFGSMIQQAMQGAKGGGGSASGGGSQPATGQPAAAQPTTGQPTGGLSAAGSGGTGAAPQPAPDAGAERERPTDEKDRDDAAKPGRPPLDSAAAGPAPHGAGPAPVHPRPGRGDDLARDM